MRPEANYSQATEWNFPQCDEEESFEKIQRRDRIQMPVAAHRSAKNGSFKTARSRRASKKVSLTSGGNHQRRLHRV